KEGSMENLCHSLIPLAILWEIWKARCSKKFEDSQSQGTNQKKATPQQITYQKWESGRKQREQSTSTQIQDLNSYLWETELKSQISDMQDKQSLKDIIQWRNPGLTQTESHWNQKENIASLAEQLPYSPR
ncbi:hypothetical protein FRX31_028215, partial [Thalictrum thalictroides]